MQALSINQTVRSILFSSTQTEERKKCGKNRKRERKIREKKKGSKEAKKRKKGRKKLLWECGMRVPTFILFKFKLKSNLNCMAFFLML